MPVRPMLSQIAILFSLSLPPTETFASQLFSTEEEDWMEKHHLKMRHPEPQDTFATIAARPSEDFNLRFFCAVRCAMGASYLVQWSYLSQVKWDQLLSYVVMEEKGKEALRLALQDDFLNPHIAIKLHEYVNLEATALPSNPEESLLKQNPFYPLSDL